MPSRPKRRIVVAAATFELDGAPSSIMTWTIGRPSPAASQDGIAVFFSPNGGCTEAIIDEIENADRRRSRSAT